MGGHEGVVDLLLRHGADMEAIDWVACKSPLHLAAKHGHLTLVELLVLYGAVIDSRDGSLRTPLHRWVKNSCLLSSFIGLDVP